MRTVTDGAVEIREGNVPYSASTRRFHVAASRDQRLREIPGIGRDAIIASAEDGVHPVDAVKSAAAAAGTAFVAAVVADVAEIGAAGALQDIAAHGRHVAELLAGGERQRLDDNRIV